MAARFPDLDAAALAYACRCLLALIQVPPRGVWGRTAQVATTTAEAWLGRPLATDPSIDEVVVRYLARVRAGGGRRRGRLVASDRPARGRSSGSVRGLRRVPERAGPELLDLPDAPRPDPDTPAPPRFLPEYDNLLLSHADRTRFVSDDDRRRLFAAPGPVRGRSCTTAPCSAPGGSTGTARTTARSSWCAACAGSPAADRSARGGGGSRAAGADRARAGPAGRPIRPGSLRGWPPRSIAAQSGRTPRIVRPRSLLAPRAYASLSAPMPAAPDPPFAHLHVHSDYSVLDGACKIDRLLDRVEQIGQSAVALTDHGVMSGAVELYRQATKRGITPVVGLEAYVVPDHRERPTRERRNHLTLLAETTEGYYNLIKLCSAGYLEGYHRKPRISHELMERHADGLIALSGCLSGVVCSSLERDDVAAARTELDTLARIFGGDDVYVEIQHAGLDAQTGINEHLRTAGRRHRAVDGGDLRRALPLPRGRRRARGAPRHPDARPAEQPEPLQVPDEGVLPQDRRRDGGGPARLPRRAAGLAGDRRAVRGARAAARRRQAAALPGARTGSRPRSTSTGCAARASHGATRRGRPPRPRSGCASSCRSSARWASPATS